MGWSSGAVSRRRAGGVAAAALRRRRAIRRRVALLLPAALLTVAAPAQAQILRGRIVDATTQAPVALGGALLLDRGQNPVAEALADSLGRFVLEAPEAGEYYLVGHGLGYSQTISSLLAVGTGEYDLELELEPEPFQFDPLEVTVRNEELIDWFRLNGGGNPNAVFGYRAIQGADLEAARLGAKDNTHMFRRLFIPVFHGRTPCLGYGGTRFDRGTRQTVSAGCGSLYVDGIRLPVEHIETLDSRTFAIVVVLPPTVYVFTRGYEWGFRPGSR